MSLMELQDFIVPMLLLRLLGSCVLSQHFIMTLFSECIDLKWFLNLTIVKNNQIKNQESEEVIVLNMSIIFSLTTEIFSLSKGMQIFIVTLANFESKAKYQKASKNSSFYTKWSHR